MKSQGYSQNVGSKLFELNHLAFADCPGLHIWHMHCTRGNFTVQLFVRLFQMSSNKQYPKEGGGKGKDKLQRSK